LDHAVFEAAVGRDFLLEPLLVFHGGDGVVDAEDLVIAGDDFAGAAGLAVVEEDETLHQIEQAVFGEHAVEQDLSFHAGLVLFIVPLPFCEMLPFAAEVIGQVVVEAGPHVQIDGFEFDEHQRQAVDETDQIGPAVVVGDAEALDLQFPDGKEAIVGGAVRAGAVLEIYDLGAGVLGFAASVAPFDRDAVADEVVVFAVVLDEGAGEIHPGQFLHGLLAGGFGEVRVEALEGGAEVADEDDFALAVATEGAGRAERFVVEGVNALPAEGIMQVIGKGLLDQAVFAVDVSDHAQVCLPESIDQILAVFRPIKDRFVR
jgi:hypothetical protein